MCVFFFVLFFFFFIKGLLSVILISYQAGPALNDDFVYIQR